MPIIRPEIFTTPDYPIVSFREEQEKINLAEELPKILQAQGWGLGTVFTIQYINHERTNLIKLARFVVCAENVFVQTSNPDGPSPMTKTVEARKAVQIEPWFYTNSSLKRTVKWNIGDKVHEVYEGDKIIFKSKDKEEAEKYRDAA